MFFFLLLFSSLSLFCFCLRRLAQIIVLLVLLCCEGVARQHPINIVLLFVYVSYRLQADVFIFLLCSLASVCLFLLSPCFLVRKSVCFSVPSFIRLFCWVLFVHLCFYHLSISTGHIYAIFIVTFLPEIFCFNFSLDRRCNILLECTHARAPAHPPPQTKKLLQTSQFYCHSRPWSVH